MLEEALSFVSVDQIKPLAEKLQKIWKQRGQELVEIGNAFGDPALPEKYYVQPRCRHHNPADRDEGDARVLT